MSGLPRSILVGGLLMVSTACNKHPAPAAKSPDLQPPVAMMRAMLLSARSGSEDATGAHIGEQNTLPIAAQPATSTPPQPIDIEQASPGASSSGEPLLTKLLFKAAQEDAAGKSPAQKDDSATGSIGTSGATVNMGAANIGDTSAVTADATPQTIASNQSSDFAAAGTDQAIAEAPAEGPADSEASTATHQPEETPEVALAQHQTPDARQQVTNDAAETQRQRDIAVRIAATYSAGPGSTGITAGADGATGVGAGNGYTGVGAGNGSTGIGAGNGSTDIGAGNGSTGIGAGDGSTGVGAGNGATGVSAGNGYTGVGAGNGATGVSAGNGYTGVGAGNGFTGVGAGQNETVVAASCAPYGGWGILFLPTADGVLVQVPVAIY